MDLSEDVALAKASSIQVYIRKSIWILARIGPNSGVEFELRD
jgi:hypothetical protein